VPTIQQLVRKAERQGEQEQDLSCIGLVTKCEVVEDGLEAVSGCVAGR